jgi:hypothetical protein
MILNGKERQQKIKRRDILKECFDDDDTKGAWYKK